MSIQIKRERILKDLAREGLVAYVWLIDKKTGLSTRHLALTDEARKVLEGLGRRET